MRPKIVILILVVAVGLVALAAVFKGIINRPKTPEPGDAATVPVTTNSPVGTALSPTPGSSPESKGESPSGDEVERELQEITDLSLAGSGNPHTAGLLAGKLTHREKEVRAAALDALIHLNDTNIIPTLEQTVGLIEDPREKVALLDAIAYLKLPEDAEPPPVVSKDAPEESIPPSSVVRSKGESGQDKQRMSTPKSPRRVPGKTRRSAIPPAAGAQQLAPPAPAPDAAPPPLQ